MSRRCQGRGLSAVRMRLPTLQSPGAQTRGGRAAAQRREVPLAEPEAVAKQHPAGRSGILTTAFLTMVLGSSARPKACLTA
jgi:hypothetical protein